MKGPDDDMTTMTFARKATDQTRRELRFFDTLRGTIAGYLPEAARGFTEVTPKVAGWRTVRMRPEVIAAVETLRARYIARHQGREMTTSEVIAAALIEALPGMTRGEFRG